MAANMESSIDFALSLLAKARDDAYVVAHFRSDPMAPDWIIGFHAQQAVEKALKAVLAVREIEYPRTHNIALLLELLHENGLPLPPGAEALPRLVPFGVALRYDEGMEDDMITLDRCWASDIVAATLQWAEASLNKGKS